MRMIFKTTVTCCAYDLAPREGLMKSVLGTMGQMRASIVSVGTPWDCGWLVSHSSEVATGIDRSTTIVKRRRKQSKRLF
jgi:hypothetical protein